MPTMHEYRRNSLTLLNALGELPKNATPRQLDHIADELTDERVLADAKRLLKTLGYDDAA